MNTDNFTGFQLSHAFALLKNHFFVELSSKAQRNMTQALAMGVSGGFMSTRLANIIVDEPGTFENRIWV